MARVPVACAAVPELAIISLDDRIRETSIDLGFEVLPPRTS